MKIAVTSQNRREVTEHAGMCRKFWIYEIENAQTMSKTLLELPKEQLFHESSPMAPHPLDDIAALISGGMGQGLVRRLAAKGISAIVTSEKDPDAAIAALLAGRLAPREPGEGCQCGHGHDHDHHHHHG
jgi:predicted Fe-Mo cluster-binding NifX family protein